MNMVGRVGSFISQGVYSVATPFHPFGGAVDIIVVEQKDGSYRSTPWYVRFGKFQGVLKGAEKMVRISVNEVEAGFHMYLDNSGEAYFIREVELEEDDDVSEVRVSDNLKALVEDVDNGNEQNEDDSVSICRNESDVSGAQEAEFSDDHVLLGTNRVEGNELDDERRFYGLADQKPSSADSIGSTDYKAYYEDLDQVGDVVESQGSESEVVLFSVDGHVITAPISSEIGNTDDIQLFTPQFHLGPCDGANFNEDNEGLNPDQETLTTDFANMDVPLPINVSGECRNADEKLPENVKVDIEVVNQVQEGHDIQCTEKCVVDHNNISGTFDCKNIDDGFRSSSELSLERHVEDVDSHDMGSPCIKLGVRQNSGASLESSPSSIPSFSNLDSPSISRLLRVEAEAPDSNALTIDNSAFTGSDSVSLHSVINDPEWKDEVEMQGTELGAPPIGSSNAGIRPSVGLGFEISLCGNLLHTGMGSRAACEAFEAFSICEDVFKLSASSIIKEENLIVRFKGKYFPWEKAAPLVLGMVAFGLDLLSETKDAICVDDEPPKVSGGTPEITSTPGSRWRLWPMAFRRVKTFQHTTSNLSNEDVFVDSVSCKDNQHTELAPSPIACNESPHKKLIRTNIPTTEQIASLSLKDGQNIITFSFSSRVLGTQKVHAHIYLWKWNARIVISDVDGTITKSDVLGQVMPLVGKDWTQTGVARLFSAIKENGYQLLFLSARAIVQAYLTRSFLLNIEQDGNTLPNGPVVISPDGLFPSLYREVIRRAPHEFKIACLEDIKALFPSDHNPFYAGFGNRDTDELSYTKIGIPKGKIFIINPKGEVAISHRIGVKSYTSLHTLVDDMFPPTSRTEQLQEDYNSWNYWRTPLPNIDI